MRGRAQVSALQMSPLDCAVMDGYAMCTADVTAGRVEFFYKEVLGSEPVLTRM